jgi:hypothetical protein
MRLYELGKRSGAVSQRTVTLAGIEIDFNGQSENGLFEIRVRREFASQVTGEREQQLKKQNFL